MPFVRCSARPAIHAFQLLRVFSRAVKESRLAAASIGLAVMVCGAWNAGHAQPSLQMLHSHVRSAVVSRQAAMVSSLPADQNMNLTIVLPLRNQSELTSLLTRLYDPSSPDYRHFLSVEQFTEEFGPTAEDYQAVVDFAQASGFTVTGAPQNRLIVPISGTVAQVNAAFNLSMREYQHPTEDRTFYSPDREPSLWLSVPVAHIAGLNNFSIPRPMFSLAQEGQAIANVNGSGPGRSYLGSDMRAAYYGGTALTGNGQAVGILEFGGYNLSDVNATFSNAGQSYGIPINNVLVDGATGGPDRDDTEQVLDIVQAIGMAPGLSQVRVYIGVGTETAGDDANIFNEMATENIAKQLSVSWGWVPDDPSTDDVFFQEFAAQGQSIFVSSGDSGAFDAAISPYFYPAEDSYVTTVGGTHLTTNSAGGSWISETAWNSEQSGSGGGISPDRIAIPSWQAGVANSSNGGSATLRNEPDVAMEGDYDNYNCSIRYGCVGNLAGTSFAAPRWAGFMALINQQAVEAGTAPLGGVGFLNPAIYPISEGSSYDSDFHDITIGNNDTENQPVWFSAVTGYDLVTGWGSPAGQNLIDALAGPQTPGFWIEASSGAMSVNQGGSSTTTVTVTGAGGFTGSVDLAITSALPSGVIATWGTNPTSGTSTLTLTASSSAPFATSNVTITGTSGTLTATTNLAVAVHAPNFTLSASPNNLAVSQGNSGTSTITVTPQYGFTGSVNLAVTSALPTGVTATWGTNPTSGTSVLTLTASDSATAGTATVTITGTSGALTATTTLSLAIQAPSFTLYANSLNIGQGSSGSTNVWVQPQYGFNGSVNLSVSGLPSGVTASWSQNPTTYSSTLTLTASNTTPVGQYTLTITGTSGNLTATATLNLGVYAPTFTLSAGSLNIGQGYSNSTWVNINSQYGFNGSVNLSVSGLPSGVTASWSQNPTTSSSTLTLTASSTAPLGQYTATITGTSGSLTATTTLSVGVFAPSFTLFVGSTQSIIGLGSSGTDFMFVEGQYGFSGSVNMSVSGLPAGVTASFSPNPTIFSTNMTLSVSSSASIGSYTLTITGTSGSITATTTVPLQIVAPTFTLYTNSTNIGQGTSTTTYVNVNPQYGFTGSVNLAVTSGLPNGVTASFAPNPTTGSCTLMLTASSTASIGQYTLTITGTSGSLTVTTTLSLGVYAPSFTLSDYMNVSVGQGSSTTSYVYVSPQYGFTGSVNLAVTSGLPSGVTASFSPNPTTGSSMLTLTASSTASLGQYTLTITGTSGSMSATTTVSLGVYVPSFTLYDYNSVTLGQGSSSTSYVNIVSQYGFAGSVNLAVTSGLPSGVTASFSPNPATGNSVLTLTASSTASLGQYTLTITGTSGSLSATTTLSLGVFVPSFTLSDYGNVTLGQGSSITSIVNINPQYGFSGSVNLSLSGLPSGVTASWSQNPATSSSTLTLTASSTASLGQYTLTITGTSGSLSATTTVSLGVFAPSFTLYDYNSVTLGQGSTSTSYVNVNPQNGFTGSVNLAVTSGLPSGVTASFAPNPTTGLSTLTLTASSAASLGQYILTITGTSGSLSATTTVSLGVFAPSFTLSDYGSTTLGQGSSSTSFVNVNPQNGFSGSVNLAVTSGLPSGVTASFAPNPTTGSSTLTLTANSTASLGQYALTITGTSGSLSATTTANLSVFAQSFTLSASVPVIGQGGSGTSNVYLTPQYGFSGSVNLAVSGLPSGVTASFSPNPTTGNSVLTLTASNTASLGQYTLTITGTSGSLTESTTVPLTVNPASFTLSELPTYVSIGQGASGSSTITVTPVGGFTGSVTLAATWLPSGVTASWGTNPTNGASVLTLIASASAALGTSIVTITGASGGLTAGTTLFVTVTVPTPVSTTTVLSITPSGGTLAVGAPYTLTATVYPASGSATPTGNVIFTTGSATQTVPVNSSGVATYSGTAPATEGMLTFSAAYQGTAAFSASTSNTVSVAVTTSAKTTPTITWAQPAAITYGTALSAAQLDASSTVAGIFVYSPAAGAELGAGPQTLTVTVTPTDSTDYTIATASVTLTVNKATPTVTVTPSSSSITTAQALTVTVAVSGGSGSSTPTGSVTLTSGSYSSASATLNAGGASINIPAGSLATGADTLTVTYAGDANFNSTAGSASVTVATPISPSFTDTGTAVTVAAGATTGNASTITVTPSGGFTGSVALTAAVTSSPAGAQYPPILSFGSTSSVSIAGAAAGTATLTVSTTATTSATLASPKRPGIPWYAAGGATLACLILFGIPARRRNWLTMLGVLVLLASLASGAIACGGGGGSGGGGGGGGTGHAGTTAGTYTVTVTATSGNITAQGPITLTVQ